MKNSISSRDKKLLLFMFLFVVIVGIGYWGVYPQIKAFINLESEIDEEEVKQSINEKKVANLVLVESLCEEYEESMANNKEKFFDRMSEADIDLLLTGKAIKHKLESFNLNIMIPENPSDRKAYRFSQLYNEQLEWEALESEAEREFAGEDEEDDIMGLTSKSDKDDEESEDDVYLDDTVDIFGDMDSIGINRDIYAASVTMVLGGEKSDLEDFLEEIMNSDKEILITSFAWSKYRVQKTKDNVIITDELMPSDIEITEMDALTITMEIYMCDKD